jgi:hypothetical protein
MGNEQGSCLKKTALYAVIGCAGTTAGMIFACLLCIGGVLWISQPPRGVTASVDAPIQLDAGDKVEFVVHVTNHNKDVVKIMSIDIGVDYFEGITLLSVTPDYDSYYVPQEATADDIRSYYFSIPVEPGETVSITFMGNAVDAGDYGGILDVCINSNYTCISNVIRTVIK